MSVKKREQSLGYLERALGRERQYWLEKLSGASLGAGLPKDADSVQSGADLVDVVDLEFREDEAQALRRASRGQDLLSFVLITAAVKLALYKYTGEDDLTIGTAPCRGQSGAVNRILALRTRVSADMKGRELVARVQSVISEAFGHQGYPFERVRASLGLAPASGGGMFGAVIVFDNIQDPADFAAVTGDIRLILHSEGGSVLGKIEYRPSLYRRESVELFAARIAAATHDLISQADERLSAIRLKEICGDAVPAPRIAAVPPCAPLHEMFEARVARAPDAVAVVDGQASVTYGELNRRANQVASKLRERGVGPEALVGVCVKRSVEMVIASVGVLKAGAAYVPLDPIYPRERLSFILEDAGVIALLTQQHIAGKLPAANFPQIRLDADGPAIAANSGENLNSFASSDNLAYVIYTSGSTGKPKGALVTHANVARLFKVTERRFNFNESDTWTLFHSYAFDFSVWEMWGALLYGGRLVIVPYLVSRSPRDFYEMLAREGVTVLNQTPSAFMQLIQAGPDSGPLALRRIIFGGEALKAKGLKDWFERHGDERPQLVNMYGITETTVHVSYYPVGLGDVEERRGSVIGTPIDDLQAHVLDETQSPAPVGVAGELYIGGAGLARGYLRRPELTAERFLPNPFAGEGKRMYRSGDEARYLIDGNLEFLGRGDRQVKLRGFRIELGEIESALLEHNQVREAVVTARETETGDKQLVAYVAGDGVKGAELRQHLKERLPDYMTPASFILLERMPLTANGKVDRRALPEPGTKSAGLAPDFIPPETATEMALANIWSEELGLDLVGRGDHFLALGGHSLLATRIASRAREELRVDLPLRSLLEDPTVAQLAAEIDQMRRAVLPRIPAVTPADRARLPLSFAQQRLWLIDQLEPGQATYNMPVAIRLEGAVDVKALRRAVSEIVRRHEVLRTRFEMNGDEPTQVIDEASEVETPVIDLEWLGEEERNRRALELAEEEASLPFDLSKGPVLRVKLLRLSEEEHVLLATIHHIAGDGWSVRLLRKEFARLYEAYARGEESPLTELCAQYADYAVWQRGWLRGEELEGQLGYWRGQLSGLTTLELPTDYARPAARGYQGAQQAFFLDEELAAALRDLGRREGATLFMTLLAGFQSLLYRTTGQEDIVVGTPIANRDRPELEGLIGFFVNTLALRARIYSKDSCRDLLRRAREITLAAYAHAQIPFEKLVMELSPKRVAGQNPIFQVWFLVENEFSDDDLILPGITTSSLKSDFTPAKLDLALTLKAHSRGIAGTLAYATDLFKPETISALIDRFQGLLRAMVRQPDCKLLDLPLTDSDAGHEALKQRPVGRIEETPAAFIF